MGDIYVNKCLDDSSFQKTNTKKDSLESAATWLRTYTKLNLFIVVL
jgi:hypothetical protein